jgi:hypothetical protein
MADKLLTQEQKQALQTVGALGAFTVAAPVGTILPFQSLLGDQAKLKIKKQEAMRMFPQADPNMFDIARTGNQSLPVIPLAQNIASSRVFNKNVNRGDLTTGSPLYPDNLYKGQNNFPIYLNAQPGAPSPELGSYAQAIGNKPIFPGGDIQAITVTPSPDPGRFAKDYAEVLADKLGKTINEREKFLNMGLDVPLYDLPVSPTDPFGTKAIEKNLETLGKLDKKISTLSSKTPGAAGYIWGNVEKPQYTYAEGNWGLGQKEAGSNPAIYLSRINADPSKEASYLFTSNILKQGRVDPRVQLTQYKDLGPSTGPSWGINEANQDISFRKDLIGARGELTVGDLQSLLAERNLPFVYQSYTKIPDRTITGSSGVNALIQGDLKPTQRPGDVLRENLQKLADAEGISTAQAIEKFARLVPNVGEPVTPPTAAVTGRTGEFPFQGQAASPFGGFAAKTDLRQIGILPPSDKARYSPFKVDEFDTMFKYVYPRYNASSINPIYKNVNPDLSDHFEIVQRIGDELNINRDALRPQAANKLLNKTVENLIEQSKPVRGLGLGGLAAGGIATAMDPAVIDALSRGDYQQAGTTAALNAAIGSAVGGATAKGLQAFQAAGYARPAAAVGSVLPLASGLLAGQGLVETGKALNRAYKSRTGKDFVNRDQVPSAYPAYAGPTPTIQPRMGTAILGGKSVEVPYGSVAGTKKVGRPWWDVVGSKFEDALNRFNAGSIIGR